MVKTSDGLTMSLPEEEESEHAEDDDEWCWGLGRKTGEGDGESALRGEELSRWSSTETSVSLVKSCSQFSTSEAKQNTTTGEQVCTDSTVCQWSVCYTTETYLEATKRQSKRYRKQMET